MAKVRKINYCFKVCLKNVIVYQMAVVSESRLGMSLELLTFLRQKIPYAATKLKLSKAEKFICKIFPKGKEIWTNPNYMFLMKKTFSLDNVKLICWASFDQLMVTPLFLEPHLLLTFR